LDESLVLLLAPMAPLTSAEGPGRGELKCPHTPAAFLLPCAPAVLAQNQGGFDYRHDPLLRVGWSGLDLMVAAIPATGMRGGLHHVRALGELHSP
jgi:hypothetical protein